LINSDLDGAIADYDKAIALNPNYAHPYAARGLTLLNIGKDQEAEQDFKKAIDLNPSLKPLIEKLADEISRSETLRRSPDFFQLRDRIQCVLR
jgi:tetratricopeptide (TPR) repeat protein